MPLVSMAQNLIAQTFPSDGTIVSGNSHGITQVIQVFVFTLSLTMLCSQKKKKLTKKDNNFRFGMVNSEH
jgi:hypothetical protein